MLELLHGPDRTANSMELLAGMRKAAFPVKFSSFQSSIHMKRNVRCACTAAKQSAGMPRF